MGRPKEFDTNGALTRAMDLFWRYGYTRTSLHDLLSHMEIGRASFYNTFGDKRQLFLLVLDRYLEDVEKSADDIVTTTSSGVDAVRRLLEEVVEDILTDSHQKGCFMVNAAVELAPYDNDVAEKVSHTMCVKEGLILRALQRAEAQGEIKAGKNLPALASTIMNTIRGLRVMARQSANPEKLRHIVEITLSVLP